MLKNIDIKNLKPGMVIVKITEQNGPVRIRKSGLVTSQLMVQGLIEMGIQQVEVDLDQTVEVEATKIKKSPTRKMLESNKVTNTRIDDGLSEQFNRSLFLPSVQDIPSAWQFYTKRYLFAAVIAMGGVGLGWTLANYQSVLTLLSPQPDIPVVNTVTSSPMPVVSATEQLEDKIESSIQVDNLQTEDTSAGIDTQKPQVTATGDIEKSFEPSEVVQTVNTPAEPEPQISADVLARFRKAITEVEDSPTDLSPVESIPSNEDVPRIDQLPAWVMNRLPSMSFSAHMYASVESQRWVRVNGVRMVEGDKIDDMVEIVRIEPQHVILNYSGQMFSMAALTDW